MYVSFASHIFLSRSVLFFFARHIWGAKMMPPASNIIFFCNFMRQSQTISCFLVPLQPWDLARKIDRAKKHMGRPKIVSVRPLSVELWRFEVGIIISVPMLYFLLDAWCLFTHGVQNQFVFFKYYLSKNVSNKSKLKNTSSPFDELKKIKIIWQWAGFQKINKMPILNPWKHL